MFAISIVISHVHNRAEIFRRVLTTHRIVHGTASPNSFRNRRATENSQNPVVWPVSGYGGGY